MKTESGTTRELKVCNIIALSISATSCVVKLPETAELEIEKSKEDVKI